MHDEWRQRQAQRKRELVETMAEMRAEGMTLEAIGIEYGYGREWVRQLLKQRQARRQQALQQRMQITLQPVDVHMLTKNRALPLILEAIANP